MAGGKETPRQKMIGMMYLVLTALLAMNISKDVLNAFLQINRSQIKTSEILESKAQATLLGLRNPKPEDAAKAAPFIAKAEQVASETDALVKYIEEFKAHVMASSMKANATGDGWEEFMADGKALDMLTEEGRKKVTKPDENQNNTTLLIGPKPQEPRKDPWSAEELKSKLETFAASMRGIKVTDIEGTEISLSPDLITSIDSTYYFGMSLDAEKKAEPWVVNKFYHTPLAAVIATISKIQTDVLNTKASVLSELLNKVGGTDMKFTDVTVAAVPLKSYVLKGEEFVAEVYLAAYNKNSTTKIYPGGEYSGPMPTDGGTPGSGGGGGGIVAGPDGKCIFKVSTGGLSLGQHGYSGQISYLKNGKEEFLKYYIPPFTVGEPALVISPKQMNVFYRGLDNPVEISVPGVSPNQMSPTCEGCEVFQKVSDSEWNVKPGSGTEAKISVSANINGSNTSMGTKVFRVKPIPDPIPSFGGKRPSDQVISKGDAGVAAGLRAAMDNFDFPVTATVQSWMITISSGGKLKEYACNSASINADASAAIKASKTGDKIFIENVICLMPDGKTRKLSPITLKLN
jgi:gliding motility-associated protein GldM